MLIIGHRGAAGLAHENSLEAFHMGVEAGADILEFDVQVTRDGELLVVHDSTLLRTHRKSTIIRWSTLASIKAATARGHQIATLKEVLDLYFGKVLLNLEIKNRGTARRIVGFIQKHYISRPEDWQNVLISSFKPSELVAARTVSGDAELALLHNKNPLLFVFYHRRINLTAVGFHRLRAPELALQIARRLGIFTYLYTINVAEAAIRASDHEVDAIVTDNPDMMRGLVE